MIYDPDKKIHNRISDLDKFKNDDNAEQIEYIKKNLFEALSSTASFDDKKDFKDYVFQDCDTLDRVETKNLSEDDEIFETVRDIQHDMIFNFEDRDDHEQN